MSGAGLIQAYLMEGRLSIGAGSSDPSPRFWLEELESS